MDSPDKLNIIKVKKILTEHLGIEPDDIELNDSLTEDLHMKPSDIVDFTVGLSSKGIETDKIDLTSIETLGDLLESLGYDIEY